MADNAVPTLAPEQKVPDVQTSQPARPLTALTTDKEALFASLAHEGFDEAEESERSPLKTFFTVLLWFGYTVAVIVALVLVWSAAGTMMKTMSH